MATRIERIIKYMNDAFKRDAGLWSHSVMDVLENIHSIWEIVNHLIFGKEYLINILEGKEIPSEDDFKTPDDTSEEAWKNTVKKLEEVHNKLIEILKGKTDEDLDKSLGEYGTLEDNLYGIISHDCYHAGQIVLILQLMGLNL
ncbi:MAG: DinB family protein [Dictyoglomus sp.]|uniref:DinB family protein n=1 Tax=Dictyoglomus sp. TaxID=28205 RepID=UPI003D0F5C41